MGSQQHSDGFEDWTKVKKTKEELALELKQILINNPAGISMTFVSIRLGINKRKVRIISHYLLFVMDFLHCQSSKKSFFIPKSIDQFNENISEIDSIIDTYKLKKSKLRGLFFNNLKQPDLFVKDDENKTMKGEN